MRTVLNTQLWRVVSLRKILVVFLAALVTLTTLGTFAPSARAALKPAGPIDPSNGYPFWYEDNNGLRLELCLDPQDQKCLQPFESPNPASPVSFPDNFPGESFWWTGEAETPVNTPAGGDALLVLAQEAAFANEEPKDGDQMAFGRIRIRVDGLVTGKKYRVTHPYGVDEFVAEEADPDTPTVGEINSTVDIGCFPTPRTPCDFNEASTSRIGPFLTWDTFGGTNDDPALRGANGQPNAYVGDPNVPHAVKGSPRGTNFFRVQQINQSGSVVETVARTNQFAVSGKIATPQVGISPREELFNAEQEVKIVPSDSTLDVRYTRADTTIVDGTTQAAAPPDPTGASDLYSAPFLVSGAPDSIVKTTIKAAAFDAQGNRKGDIATKTYTIDRKAPHVTASLEPKAYEGTQQVTLSANDSNDPQPKIYYTKDGSTPPTQAIDGSDPTLAEKFLYDGQPITIDRSTTIKAIAVDADGNQSRVETFAYQIAALAETATERTEGGYPLWYRDAGTAERGPLALELCLDPQDPKCLQPLEMPNPTGAVSFPNNFPAESFWWTGAADAANLVGGGDALLVLAQEAAFANEEPKAGDEMSFARVRVRVDGLETGATYKVTHPYGVDEFVAEEADPDTPAVGEINYTEDIGCFPTPTTPCDFDDARFGRIGPFLTWDTFGGTNDDPALRGADGQPNAYVGDPNVPHAVKGSPYDTNFFKVEKVANADGTPASVLVAEQNQFAVSGKVIDTTTPDATAPAAPTIGTASAGSTTDGVVSATARWNAPANDGGSAITGYTVTAIRQDNGVRTTKPAGPNRTQLRFDGLRSGQNYRFVVQAVNAVGTGPESAQSNSVRAR